MLYLWYVDDPTGDYATSEQTVNSNPKRQKLQKKPFQPAVLMFSQDSDAVFTSTSYAEEINEQIAKYFYATNTLFSHVGHQEFIKLCQLLRPRYKPPNEKCLPGDLLNTIYKKVIEESKHIYIHRFSWETFTKCPNGWSNVRNEPLICASVITLTGENYLSSTIDTSWNSHDSHYLCTLAKKSV